MSYSDSAHHDGMGNSQPADHPRRDSAIAMQREISYHSVRSSETPLNSTKSTQPKPPANIKEAYVSHSGPDSSHEARFVGGLPPADIYADTIPSLPFSSARHYHIAEHLKQVYRFFIRIGVLEANNVSFGPHNFTYSQLKAFANAGFDDHAIALLKVLPWPIEAINLDWNSQALNWSDVLAYDHATGDLDPHSGRGPKHLPFCLSNELKPSEVPLTEFKPYSLGFYWVVDAKTGKLKRSYFSAGAIAAEVPWGDESTEDEQLDAPAVEKATLDDFCWDGDAVELLSEYLACLQRLDMIPVRRWVESEIKPGFVAQSESVYEDVKIKLSDYGWPYTFKREEWVRDLPDMVARWKTEKVRRLEEADAYTQV